MDITSNISSWTVKPFNSDRRTRRERWPSYGFGLGKHHGWRGPLVTKHYIMYNGVAGSARRRTERWGASKIWEISLTTRTLVQKDLQYLIASFTFKDSRRTLPLAHGLDEFRSTTRESHPARLWAKYLLLVHIRLNSSPKPPSIIHFSPTFYGVQRSNVLHKIQISYTGVHLYSMTLPLQMQYYMYRTLPWLLKSGNRTTNQKIKKLGMAHWLVRHVETDKSEREYIFIRTKVRSKNHAECTASKSMQ